MEGLLRCISCGKNYPASEVIYRCSCGDILDIVYDFGNLPDVSDLKRMFNERLCSSDTIDISGVWRFRELLPFVSDAKRANIVTMPEGNTTIYCAKKSAEYAGMKKIMLKHQGLNPTGSFKDNGMTTGTTAAKILGFKRVACASTGNTSASMSAYASRGSMVGIVFIPDGKQIAFGKLSQSLDFGALTLKINGDFDDAMNLVESVSAKLGIYLLNSINPFRLEGQKTIMCEMVQQLGWNVPDYVVVPGGNLGNSSSFGKGLKEMYDIGLINKLPKIVIVQAEGAAPLYNYIKNNKICFEKVKANTRATAIKIGNPVSWKKAVRALDYTGGLVESVTEEEISFAKAVIGRDGIGCEPASATTLAGVKKLVEKGIIDKSSSVVCILTGNMLKDPDYTVEFHTNDFYLNSLYEKKYTLRDKKIDTTNFANEPISVEAESDAIIAKILEFEKKMNL